jgi:hypothetical protein
MSWVASLTRWHARLAAATSRGSSSSRPLAATDAANSISGTTAEAAAAAAWREIKWMIDSVLAKTQQEHQQQHCHQHHHHHHHQQQQQNSPLPVRRAPRLSGERIVGMLQQQTTTQQPQPHSRMPESLLPSSAPPLTASQQALLEQMLADRVERGKPLQYVLGDVEFCGLTLGTVQLRMYARTSTHVLHLSARVGSRCGACTRNRQHAFPNLYPQYSFPPRSARFARALQTCVPRRSFRVPKPKKCAAG